jgi:hypothetical protein
MQLFSKIKNDNDVAPTIRILSSVHLLTTFRLTTSSSFPTLAYFILLRVTKIKSFATCPKASIELSSKPGTSASADSHTTQLTPISWWQCYKTLYGRNLPEAVFLVMCDPSMNEL